MEKCSAKAPTTNRPVVCPKCEPDLTATNAEKNKRRKRPAVMTYGASSPPLTGRRRIRAHRCPPMSKRRLRSPHTRRRCSSSGAGSRSRKVRCAASKRRWAQWRARAVRGGVVRHNCWALATFVFARVRCGEVGLALRSNHWAVCRWRFCRALFYECHRKRHCRFVGDGSAGWMRWRTQSNWNGKHGSRWSEKQRQTTWKWARCSLAKHTKKQKILLAYGRSF